MYKISNGYTEISVENEKLLKDIVVASLETNKEITIRKEKN